MARPSGGPLWVQSFVAQCHGVAAIDIPQSILCRASHTDRSFLKKFLIAVEGNGHRLRWVPIAYYVSNKAVVISVNFFA